MFKYCITLFVLFRVEVCSSDVDIVVKNLRLESKQFGNLCWSTNSTVVCTVEQNKKATLFADWVVNGGNGALGLENLQVSLKWSDNVGDIDNIHVCQITGGTFEFVKETCSLFEVPDGTYPQKPYEFQIPKSKSRATVFKYLSISASTKWSDGSNFTKIAGGLGVFFV